MAESLHQEQAQIKVNIEPKITNFTDVLATLRHMQDVAGPGSRLVLKAMEIAPNKSEPKPDSKVNPQTLMDIALGFAAKGAQVWLAQDQLNTASSRANKWVNTFRDKGIRLITNRERLHKQVLPQFGTDHSKFIICEAGSKKIYILTTGNFHPLNLNDNTIDTDKCLVFEDDPQAEAFFEQLFSWDKNADVGINLKAELKNGIRLLRDSGEEKSVIQVEHVNIIKSVPKGYKIYVSSLFPPDGPIYKELEAAANRGVDVVWRRLPNEKLHFPFNTFTALHEGMLKLKGGSPVKEVQSADPFVHFKGLLVKDPDGTPVCATFSTSNLNEASFLARTADISATLGSVFGPPDSHKQMLADISEYFEQMKIE